MVPEQPGAQWLFEALETIRTEQRDQHQRLRSDLTAGKDVLREDFKEIALKVDQIGKDVLTLQVQRDMEERQSVKRSTAVAVVVSAMLTGLFKMVEILFPHHH